EQFVNGQADDMLAQLDTNKDGKISLEEFLGLASSAPAANASDAKVQLTAAFGNLDTDKNKAIDRKELGAHFTNVFNRLDTDKNGKLTQREISAASGGGPAPARPAAKPPTQSKPPAASSKPPASRPAAAPKPAPKPAPQPAPQGGP